MYVCVCAVYGHFNVQLYKGRMAEYLPERPKLSEVELDQYLKADNQVQHALEHIVVVYYCFSLCFSRLIFYVRLTTVAEEATL